MIAGVDYPRAEEQNAITFVETLGQRLGGKGSGADGNGASSGADGNGASSGAAHGGGGGGGGSNSEQPPQEDQSALPGDSPFELRALEVALEMVCSYFGITHCFVHDCIVA